MHLSQDHLRCIGMSTSNASSIALSDLCAAQGWQISWMHSKSSWSRYFWTQVTTEIWMACTSIWALWVPQVALNCDSAGIVKARFARELNAWWVAKCYEWHLKKASAMTTYSTPQLETFLDETAPDPLVESLLINEARRITAESKPSRALLFVQGLKKISIQVYL